MRQDPGSDAEVVVSSHMYSYTGLTVGNDLLFTTGVNQTWVGRKSLKLGILQNFTNIYIKEYEKMHGIKKKKNLSI